MLNTVRRMLLLKSKQFLPEHPVQAATKRLFVKAENVRAQLLLLKITRRQRHARYCRDYGLGRAGECARRLVRMNVLVPLECRNPDTPHPLNLVAADEVLGF